MRGEETECKVQVRDEKQKPVKEGVAQDHVIPTYRTA